MQTPVCIRSLISLSFFPSFLCKGSFWNIIPCRATGFLVFFLEPPNHCHLEILKLSKYAPGFYLSKMFCKRFKLIMAQSFVSWFKKKKKTTCLELGSSLFSVKKKPFYKHGFIKLHSHCFQTCSNYKLAFLCSQCYHHHTCSSNSWDCLCLLSFAFNA